MFGNLLNNTLIKRAERDRLIDMGGFFKPDKVQVAQYPLTAKAIRYRTAPDEKFKQHLLDDGEYTFQPREYAIAVVRERLVLADGIVGRFIPSSSLIEKGFGLTCGKLDPGYGASDEEIRFGLYNLCDWENKFTADSGLAYIQFFDVQGLSTEKWILSESDRIRWESRRQSEEEIESM